MNFDIVEYIIMDWTMPNESRICRTVLILNKRRRDLLATLQSSIGQKRIPGLNNKQGRLRGGQVLDYHKKVLLAVVKE